MSDRCGCRSGLSEDFLISLLFLSQLSFQPQPPLSSPAPSFANISIHIADFQWFVELKTKPTLFSTDTIYPHTTAAKWAMLIDNQVKADFPEIFQQCKIPTNEYSLFASLYFHCCHFIIWIQLHNLNQTELVFTFPSFLHLILSRQQSYVKSTMSTRHGPRKKVFDASLKKFYASFFTFLSLSPSRRRAW